MQKRKHITIRDIARESGASLTTVSLVLNKRDSRISSATRKRVLDVVDRLGYRPSRLAQGLQARRSHIIAILVPELRNAFADAYVGELISAAYECAAKSQYKLLLEMADPDFIARGQYRELFDRHFVDGMLCIGVTSRDSYLADFEDGLRPMLILNNYIDGLDLNYVRCDYEAAGRLAAEYLLSLGHHRIGLIRGAVEVRTSHDLCHGFEMALNAAGHSLPESMVVDGKYTEEGGADAARLLLKRDPKLTAIFAGNDKMAIGAMATLTHLGRHIPDDLSVIGCDDLRQAAYCIPPLTTIQTPLHDLGYHACECLLDLVEGRRRSVRETRPVRLIARESAAPPPKPG